MQQKLSIVTICFNNLQEVIETCRSVDNQSMIPTEHLIIDGSTNKEVLEWLTSISQPTYRKWLSERDGGISDGFNKGIKLAKCEIIHLLNSGDKYFTENAIAVVLENFAKYPDLMWTHCQYVQHRGDADVISGVPFDKNKLWKGMRTVAHPTMFVKSSLYKKHGLFDPSYSIAMDFDFLVRIRNEKFLFIPEPLLYFSPGGASNIYFKKGLAEVKRSYTHYLGSSFKLMIWQRRQSMLEAIMHTTLGKLLFRIKNRKHTVST